MISVSDHNRLLVKVARLYYEQEMTQGEIARRLRLSRQKVQRLLHQAHHQGVVRIGIRPIMGIFSDLDNRVIGLTLDEIKKIDHVVGVAGGAEKFKAIRAALKGKLANVLITDHMTAQRLLKVESPSRSLASSNSKQGRRLRSSPRRTNQGP
jgi:DNA-binding transcriptional regulator LsrR (DeoR family)